ncbi:MAG: nicotinate-nucleotide adenylyltransferase [Candidatus Binatia bacterium]
MSKAVIAPRERRVGILGGTFNPIHIGHLRSAEEVREEQHLDRVLFVPSATPPHKRTDGLVAARHRLAMVQRAIAGNPYFRVSTIEIDRRGRSYSVDTLRCLRARMRHTRFFFIMGIDAFREIATWKDYRSIFLLCDLVVTSRPPVAAPALRAALPVAVRREFCYRLPGSVLEHSTGHQVIFQRVSGLAVSASAIRHRLGHRLSVRYLLPPAVERYIAQHRLYTRRVRPR